MNVSFGLLMSRGNLGMDVPLEKLVRRVGGAARTSRQSLEVCRQ